MANLLRKLLEKKDKRRGYICKYKQNTDVKRKRMAKISAQIIHNIEENKKAITEGKDYASGVAIQAEKVASKKVLKLMTEQGKKNKGLPKSLQTCKFYPVYCSCTGYVDARSRSCGMFGTSKQQKEDAVKNTKGWL